MVVFAGWEMPMQFTGIVAEHTAVRTRAGLFDVSHMGEIEFVGPGAFEFLQGLVTNDLTRIAPGQALYTPMTNDAGGCLDDLVIYRLEPERFLAVVNAANTAKDMAWFRDHAPPAAVTITDRSAEVALLALQGPLAEAVLQPLTRANLSGLRRFRFFVNVVAGVRCLVSTTGYTGEDGFELYTRATDAIKLWDAILEAGRAHQVLPCGLGARDTLRLEAALPLYGHELVEDITPLEAGLSAFVKLTKGPFPGWEVLRRQAEDGPPRMLCGLRLTERGGVPRQGYPVWSGDRTAGIVTSGTMSPTLREPVALAMMERGAAGSLAVDIRGRRVAAELVPLPFYRRPTVRARKS
ncbi:MAG: glycine cleavage system aminomethyltransferase GcvT [Alicyclobacillaceae bacterium]|nr:glycine cleavage system aminomethyltransferase GcvT [Alicyclobacillaceae bacterium]